jgi:hypothetical protein
VKKHKVVPANMVSRTTEKSALTANEAQQSFARAVILSKWNKDTTRNKFRYNKTF